MSDLLNKVTDHRIQGTEGQIINYQGRVFEGDFVSGPGIYSFNSGKWAPVNGFMGNKLRRLVYTNKQDIWAKSQILAEGGVPRDLFGSVPLIELDRGNIAIISWILAVLPNNIYIAECYDMNSADDLNGYWVAFKKDRKTDTLEKIAELKMTEQFWDYWFDWAVTGGELMVNEVKFYQC
jgi:hypothetical protein